MIMVLLSWIYIGLVCMAAGELVLAAAHRLTGVRGILADTVPAAVISGMTFITVYAEIFSLFGGVGAVCHLLLLLFMAVLYVRFPALRKGLGRKLMGIRALAFSYEGLLYLGLILLLAFFASRGTFHTDTNIYHAQAIRLIEEYGTVRGIANIQLHFGYNSAYLVFCAFFTLGWLLPQALHTTTGFLAALLLLYACFGLRRAGSHRRHAADGARVALILYILTNLTGLMSPATDYGTLLVVHYLLCAWLDAAEQAAPETGAAGRSPGNPQHSLQPPARGAEERESALADAKLMSFGMLSVLALFASSMKLSSAPLVLLALWPVVLGIRQHRGRWLLGFTGLGLLCFAPFLIRNVLLSGWLFYPFGALDLFQVVWKVPLPYLQVDAAQIKVWGRCLYDVALLDTPFREWFPIWWEAQQHYAQMLLYADLLSPLLLGISFVMERRAGKRRGRPDGAMVLFLLAASLSLLFWFAEAPFVRYGLAFILTLPLVSAGIFVQTLRRGISGRAAFWKVPGVLVLVCTGICFCAWTDHYAMDGLVFIKHNLTQPYYLAQKPFENRPEGSVILTADGQAAEGGGFDGSVRGEASKEALAALSEGGIEIYYPLENEMNSYYVFPSTAYRFMADRSMPLGERVKDGFRAK